MAKIVPGDLKAILRLFGVAGSDDSDKHIDQIKTSHPLPTNTLIAFRFNKRRYFALFDETAEDDVDYMTEQINSEAPDISGGAFIENPSEAGLTYGVPHKGKSVYLYSVDIDKKRLDSALAESRPELSRSTW